MLAQDVVPTGRMNTTSGTCELNTRAVLYRSTWKTCQEAAHGRAPPLSSTGAMMLDSMPYLSLETIDYHARKLLEGFQCDALMRPEPVDVLALIEHHLEATFVVEEMDVEALTSFKAEVPEIRLRLDQFEALCRGGEDALRPRASLAHEVGHIVLHADHADALHDGCLVRSDDFEGSRGGSAEWQAWGFAGCLMMPTPVLVELVDLNPHNVSRVFEISPQFARRHLLRLRAASMV